MNIHKNARLTPLRREEMALSVIEGGVSKAQAARTFGVSAKIVARWVERYRAQGSKGMADRSSRPNVMPGLTEQAVADRIVALRRQAADRQAYRQGGWRLARHRQPGS